VAKDYILLTLTLDYIRPGEELKKHTDRPACEISATVTLGFEGDVWSIYMAGNKVDMQVGDAVSVSWYGE
jgi:hypothetical protein